MPTRKPNFGLMPDKKKRSKPVVPSIKKGQRFPLYSVQDLPKGTRVKLVFSDSEDHKSLRIGDKGTTTTTSCMPHVKWDRLKKSEVQFIHQLEVL